MQSILTYLINIYHLTLKMLMSLGLVNKTMSHKNGKQNMLMDLLVLQYKQLTLPCQPEQDSVLSA